MEENKLEKVDVNSELIPIIISNSYNKKYYLDNRLEVLPDDVKKL